MKVHSFRPQVEPIEGLPGGPHELRTPGEDAYCAWEDAKLSQAKFSGEDGKVVEHTALYKNTRALLVGLCLFKPRVLGEPEPEPMGERWVRENVQPGSITRMYEWCVETGGFAIPKDDLKNS